MSTKQRTIAYCYRSGQIGFTTGTCPDGTLPLISGSKRYVTKRIEARARLAYDNETYLVPGFPEATDEEAALSALYDFMDDLHAPRLAQRAADEFAHGAQQ